MVRGFGAKCRDCVRPIPTLVNIYLYANENRTTTQIKRQEHQTEVQKYLPPIQTTQAKISFREINKRVFFIFYFIQQPSFSNSISATVLIISDFGR